ncbi:glycosyltransferase [Halocatena halophila]|uniref:glycosyltransferase n=1 Tax=Halocatena halophila TaxID=2814576 RepID=UPI002ED2F5C0
MAANAFDDPIRVLQVATSNRSFFSQQVSVLEARNVECETLIVPRPREGTRGVRSYLSVYLQLLGKSLADFDLIHVNYGLLAPMGVCQPGRPLVVTLWGSDVLGPRWLKVLSETSVRFSDAVIAPTKPLQRALSVPSEFVPFGIDYSLFRPIDRGRAREELGWPKDEHVVLFPYDPGREEKNAALARRITNQLEGVRLETVTGVPYKSMPTYMNASDALLITSNYESGPLSVCEAAACNVPVVSRDVGFVSDVLDGVEPSVITNDEASLRDGLAEILAGDRRSNGRSVTDRSLDRFGDGITRVYQKVLN